MFYKPVKVTLANGNITTSDDTIAGSGRPKNKTCLSELKTMNFIQFLSTFILFLFLFSLFSMLRDLEVGSSMTSQSHGHDRRI